ncbi:MAG TPA: ATP-dependent metalloprotease, partial [Gammaproteobacteria bacterium]|nr:ATP-dependent metalloprotease [Gammaproteobacteria bacterium]
MNDLVKNLLLWVVIAIVLMSVFQGFNQPATMTSALSYSQFINEVKNSRIKTVHIDGRKVQGITVTGEKFTTYTPNDPQLINDLLAHNVEVQASPPQQRSLLLDILIS